MSRIEGRRIEFQDGTQAEVDAIVFGTGFDLHLPFLGEDLRRSLGARARKRIEESLNWDIEKRELLKAYEAALQDR